MKHKPGCSNYIGQIFGLAALALRAVGHTCVRIHINHRRNQKVIVIPFEIFKEADWRFTFGTVVHMKMGIFEEIRDFGGLYDMFHLGIS